MLLTGRVVDAATALQWGLVSRVVPHEDFADAATQALVECCRGAPGARLALKRVVNNRYGRYDRISMEASFTSEEFAEGCRAFTEQRPPGWIPDDLRPEGRV